MSNDSDVNFYQLWFGIPSDQNPPDFYQLLGIERFESDHSKIDDATEQRSTFLQDITDGPNIGKAQEILNQIAAARVCLTDPKSKQEYDAALKQHLENPGQSQPFEFDFEIKGKPRTRGYRKPTARKNAAKKQAFPIPLIIAGACLGVVLLAGLGITLFFQFSSPDTEGPDVQSRASDQGSTRTRVRQRRVVSKVRTQKKVATELSLPAKEFIKQIRDFGDYTEVLTLDLAKLSKDIEYDFDTRNQIESFDRVAYLIELQEIPEEQTKLLFVSMKAFTDKIDQIGVPTLSSGAIFQQQVESLNVYCNVDAVTAGEDIQTGNMEFWPNSYSPANRSKLAGADSRKFDFDDTPNSGNRDGHGSMQIHNFGAKQTLFAINNWSKGLNAAIGIGNDPNRAHPDWTHANNADNYCRKLLRVYVREK